LDVSWVFFLFLVVSKRYTGIPVTGLFAFVLEEKDEIKNLYFHKSGTGEHKTTGNRYTGIPLLSVSLAGLSSNVSKLVSQSVSPSGASLAKLDLFTGI
jgi:hypothetical protein